MSRQLEHVPVQDPWAQLGHLCGVDLTGAVPCGWTDYACDQPAQWVMVQEHLRPPIPCLRAHLCGKHRLAVEMAEQRELREGTTRMVCTVHHRDVPTRSRWEPL